MKLESSGAFFVSRAGCISDVPKHAALSLSVHPYWPSGSSFSSFEGGMEFLYSTLTRIGR